MTIVRVWDLPTRLFHWLLAGLFVFSWWSAENREMEWHLRSGAVLLGLLVFRLLWGVAGSSTARFASFVRSPAAVLHYIRGSASEKRAGHNPLGGYSVLAMLLALAVQIASGLFATDVDGLESGPLSYRVSFDQGRAAAEIHEGAFAVLQVLVAVHILAILFYLFVRRRNLVRPMVTGNDHALGAGVVGTRGGGMIAFAACTAIAAGFAWWIATGMGG